MWAETGVATPMYRSPEARDEAIALSAQGAPITLRVELIAVDLDAGVRIADSPPNLVDAFLDDITAAAWI